MQFRSMLVIKGINILEFITRIPYFEHIILYLHGPITDAI